MEKPPKIMAIETSGRMGSVALAQGPTLLAEQSFSSELAHARELLPTMADACRQLGWQPHDIDQLYMSAGPGSFTGLRIGVSVAKALAFAANCRIVPVPSTEALVLNAAEAAEQDGLAIENVALVLDAKRRQIYTAVYQHDPAAQSNEANGFAPGFTCLTEACFLKPSELLGNAPRPLHVLGEGLPIHAAAFEGQADVTVLEQRFWPCRAAHVHACGYRRAAAGLFVRAEELQPWYLRRPEAVERWEKLHGSDG